MVTWDELKRWKPEGLDSFIDLLVNSRKKAVGGGDHIETMDLSTGWEGEGAAAAQQRRDRLDRKTVLLLKNIGELIKATAEAQEGLGEVSTMVVEAESRASHFGFKISADGTTVTDPNPIKKSFGDLISPWDTDHEEDKKEREEHLEECKVHVRNARKKADEVDRAYEAALLRIAGGKVKSSGRLEDPNPGLSKQPPSNNTEEVAAWWAAHTDAEKQALAEESPEMVGNLDGVEAKYRNIANRKLLNRDLQQYKPVADRLEQLKRANPGKSESQLLSRDELLQLKYYREAKNVEKALTQNGGNTQLLIFQHGGDETGAKHAHAAIAVGDVDTAKHVTTFIPGMGTDVSKNMDRVTRDVVHLKEVAEKQSSGESVAAIGWVGYDAPPAPWESNPGKSIKQWDFSVLGKRDARMGGDAGAKFLEGIRDSRNAAISGTSDVHQSLLGHSYGSTTASYAAAQARPGVIDDFGVFGSSGVKNGSWDMNVPQGHRFVSLFKDDPIRTANVSAGFAYNHNGSLGMDPYDDSGFKKLNPEGPGTKITGHSGYLVNKSHAQWQLASIVVGKAH
jgi:hypothetical protein